MRILYLHQYFQTRDTVSVGGTRSYEMARRLVEWGHDVQMVTTSRDADALRKTGWFQTVESGIHVHWLYIPYSNHMDYRERLQAFFRFAWAAGRKAASLGGDVVFATSTPLTIALPGVYASKRNGAPMVFEIRDLWPELPIAVGALKHPAAIGAARRLERFAYRHSRRIVALSPDMKAAVVRTGYPESQVTVLPNSCDVDLFNVSPASGWELRRRYQWLQDRPLVVYTGTLGHLNGVDYLARLAAEVYALDRDIRFLVIGSGKEEEKVRKTAQECGVLERNFFMMQQIARCQIPAWLSAADLPTSLFIDLREMWANSANKFFDALAAGKPVAINYGGWQADILRETGAGLLLNPRDMRSTALQVVQALRDSAWLAQAGTAARKLAAERFSRDVLTRRLETVLRQAVEGTSREEVAYGGS